MEAAYSIILVGSALLVVSILSGALAIRMGAPLLLIFLGVGLIAGEDGLLGIAFSDAPMAFLVGSAALAVILFESGFDTRLSAYRAAAWPAMTLATVGVGVTTGVVGLAAHYLLNLPWVEAFLLGSVVSSTDAAAVFMLLRVGGITIRERVRSALEIESGSNDPMAILLTILLVEMATSGHVMGAGSIALEFLLQMGGGVIAGMLGGVLLVACINGMKLDSDLYPVISLTLALFIFGATAQVGASGFLAVYVAGLVAGNVHLRGAQGLRRFHSGLTWLSQIVMFVLLGMFATPRNFIDIALPAAALAALLTLVARPLAVWLCLIPFRFTANETTFVAWVGLRGAVSILLALVPILGGLENGQVIFNTAFLVVVLSLVVQGWTIRPMARWLGLIIPPRTGPVDRVELELPGEANHELVAYTVHAKSPAARGQKVPRWARPSLVIRNGVVVPIYRAKPLQGGDHIYVFAAPSRLPLLDRLYGGTRPLDQDDHQFFGDLVLNPDVTVVQVAELYGLPLALPNADLTLHALFAKEFGAAVEIGDRLRMGGVELIVRDMEGAAITSVGLALEPTPVSQPRIALFENPATLMRRAFGRWRAAIAFRLWQWRERRQNRRASESAAEKNLSE